MAFAGRVKAEVGTPEKKGGGEEGEGNVGARRASAGQEVKPSAGDRTARAREQRRAVLDRIDGRAGAVNLILTLCPDFCGKRVPVRPIPTRRY